MSQMDSYLYDLSLKQESSAGGPMIEKEVLYATDSNGGSYNGQIQLDTAILSNSGRWLAYSEAYLEIPFVMSLQSNTDITGGSLSHGFMQGLKSGNWQIIDSIQVDLNNTNVVQLQPYTNFYCSYKAMSTWSLNDLAKYGQILGMAPDTAGSGSFAVAAAACGNGYSNNVVANPPAVFNPLIWSTTSGDLYNAGFLKRLQATSYPLSTNNTGYGVNGLIVSMTSASQANLVSKSYFSDNAGVAAARIYQWVMMLTIRLKDLADFFDKIPLMKGAFLRFTINYNSCQSVVTALAAGPSLLQAVPTMYSGRTNPMMMASSLANNPMNLAVAGGNATFTSQCGVGKTPTSILTPAISSVRLYVPSYTLNPVMEEAYLSVQREKQIVYNDIYNYNITGVGSGVSFNQILTNGLADVQQLVVIPFYNNAANNAATLSINPYQSIFDPAPATTSPLAAISQFNVQLSGKNVFQQNQQYDFEQFMNEMAPTGSINGGCSVGLSSGLLGRWEWDNLYRYYVCDLSRRIPSEDRVPKSVQVLGLNNTAKIMDYICFIIFSRSIRVDLVTGSIIG
jgi:hypothetical protein